MIHKKLQYMVWLYFVLSKRGLLVQSGYLNVFTIKWNKKAVNWHMPCSFL